MLLLLPLLLLFFLLKRYAVQQAMSLLILSPTLPPPLSLSLSLSLSLWRLFRAQARVCAAVCDNSWAPRAF